MSNWVTAIATVVIAWATIKTWFVYSRMYGQVAEQTRLTRDMFLESHRPMLSVSITDCVYSEGEELLKGRIKLKNHGTAVANQIDLSMSFGGTNFIKKIDRIAIQPKDKITHTLSLEIARNQYEAGKVEGNRINVLIQGSYKGIANQTYSYNERQNYDPDLKHFVPSVAW